MDAEIIDGNEALYHSTWPKNTSLCPFVSRFANKFRKTPETFVIFDCDKSHSIKSPERQRRARNVVRREYELKDETILPS